MIELSADPARRARELPKVVHHPEVPFVSERARVCKGRADLHTVTFLGPLERGDGDRTITREEYYRRTVR